MLYRMKIVLHKFIFKIENQLRNLKICAYYRLSPTCVQYFVLSLTSTDNYNSKLEILKNINMYIHMG